MRLKITFYLVVLATLSCNAPPKPNFKVAGSSGEFTVTMNKDLDTWGMNVDIKGSVANVSSSTLNNYELIVNYASYNEKGEVYMLKDKAELYIWNYGFGGGFAKRTSPWAPKENKEFKLSDHISIEDSLFPTSQIFVLVFMRASDPFGNNFNEAIAMADITDQWHKAQAGIKKRLDAKEGKK